jgi:hypothetical protein
MKLLLVAIHYLILISAARRAMDRAYAAAERGNVKAHTKALTKALNMVYRIELMRIRYPYETLKMDLRDMTQKMRKSIAQ